MSTASITTGTTVRHTDGTALRISHVGTVPEGSTLSPIVTIERQDADGDWLYATSGPASALVEAGYVFGDEATFTSTPAEVVAEPVVLPLDSEVLATQVAGLTATVGQRDQRISTLEHELTRANERVEQFRTLQHEALRDKTRLAEAVTARLKEAVGDGVLDKDDANSILDDLDCKRITSEYRVTVECEGQTVLVVVVEADDEDDACDKVRDDLGATIQRVEIEVEFEYGGDGEIEESDTYTDEDESGVDASDYLYNVDISAEEV